MTERWCQCNLKRFYANKRKIRVSVACFLSVFSSAFSYTLLFPFLPFMIQFLLPDIEYASIGNYAGALASSLFLGRLISGYVWGAIADLKGRKVVLIASGVLAGLSSGAFGFSTSYFMAVGTRFLIGLFNGIVGTSKAILSESSDDSSHALSMAIITSALCTGVVLGPAVAGAIADPVGQYNLTILNPAIHYFLTSFPYSLPCIVSMLLYILSSVVVLICLPETLTKKNKKHGSAELSLTEEDELNREAALTQREESHCPHECVESGHACKKDSSVELPVTMNSPTPLVLQLSRSVGTSPTHHVPMNSLHFRDRKQNPNIDTELLLEERNFLHVEDEGNVTVKSWSERCTICCIALLRRRLSKLRKGIVKPLKNLVFFIRDKDIRNALFIYSIYSFLIIAFDDIYPLWTATPRYQGGLGFSLHDIGISLTVVGVTLLPLSFFLFAALERYIGSIKTFQLSATGQIFAMVLLPTLHYIENPVLVWAMLCLMMSVIRVNIALCLASSYLFINNSVTFDKLGSVNGLGMAIAAFFRTVAPVFAGSIYSVSLTNGLSFPLNYNLIFIIFGIIMLVVMVMVACLPQTINKQKGQRVSETEEHTASA